METRNDKNSKSLNLEKDKKFPESPVAKDAQKKGSDTLNELQQDVADRAVPKASQSSENRAGVSDLEGGLRRAEDV